MLGGHVVLQKALVEKRLMAQLARRLARVQFLVVAHVDAVRERNFADFAKVALLDLASGRRRCRCRVQRVFQQLELLLQNLVVAHFGGRSGRRRRRRLPNLDRRETCENQVESSSVTAARSRSFTHNTHTQIMHRGVLLSHLGIFISEIHTLINRNTNFCHTSLVELLLFYILKVGPQDI